MVIAAVLMIAASCSSSEVAAPPTDLAFAGDEFPLPEIGRVDPETLTIGVSMQNLSRTFFQGLESGVRGEAASMGVDVVVTDAGDQAGQQAVDVQTLINAGVDGIVISPVDSAAAEDLVAIANEAGVPVVAVANQIGSVEQFGAQFLYPGTEALVTNDDVEMGRRAAQFTAEIVDPTGVASIAVLEGKAGSANVAMRFDGFVDELAALAVDFEIAASASGEWTGDGGRLACAELAAQPDIAVLFSMSDAMTAGCVESIEAAGRSDIDIVSIGGNAEGIALVHSGVVTGTVCQKPGTMGSLAIQTIVDVLEGSSSVPGLRFYDTPVVTAQNQSTVCVPQW